MITKALMIGGAVAIGVASLNSPAQAQSRDQIRIVGSSTVFPFTTAAAEQFGRAGKFKAPVVESTGTGGGMKLFCAGVGVQHPDMTGASRRIKKSEFDDCQKNGVAQITEIPIGFDGIVLANAKQAKPVNMTRKQIFQALAKQVPQNGQLVNNPYQTWNQIDPSLPNAKIEVLGPPPTSGTRDAFVELVMDEACEQFPEIKAMDSKAKRAACQTLREDGAFVEAGENDNLIVQKLASNPNAFGIFGYSFLDQNRDKLQGSVVDGVQPTYENISSGKYPVSRSMYMYAKNPHVGVIPGMREFIAEYSSDRAMGPDGYLARKGLIALPDAQRKKAREEAMNLQQLTM